ncbi:hypothetical protein [Sphingomonas sp. LR55]|uniref:hypothetical protein n=1 Tax=Sphingomonas sp. LR55 TaxID=3050231 RepID=UPI002FE08B7C
MRLPASYRGLWGALSRYWRDYGGWRDFFRSPLLHFSVAVAGASYSAWLKPDWTDLPLSLLPNLLGFSLGAYALIFSLANERLLAALNVPTADGRSTNLRIVNATFLHFILVQTSAIIFALANRSTLFIDGVGLLPLTEASTATVRLILSSLAGAVGYFLTVYAVVLLVGAALAAYRLAIMSGKAASVVQQIAALPAAPPATSSAGSKTE